MYNLPPFLKRFISVLYSIGLIACVLAFIQQPAYQAIATFVGLLVPLLIFRYGHN